MPDLYHAARKELPLNQAIAAQERNTKPIDREFDNRRPGGLVARSIALFSSDDPAFAFTYLLAELAGGGGAQASMYEVEMPEATKHPMILVNHAQKFIQDPATLAKIIAEYWNPTREWKCWEYLGSSMTPIADELPPVFLDQMGAKYRYGEDFNLAHQLWPCPRPT
jgi:hypothetical protein